MLGVWSKAITAPALAGAVFRLPRQAHGICLRLESSLVLPASRPVDISRGLWHNLRSCFRVRAVVLVNTEPVGKRGRKVDEGA